MEKFVSFDDYPKTPAPFDAEDMELAEKYLEEQIKKMTIMTGSHLNLQEI